MFVIHQNIQYFIRCYLFECWKSNELKVTLKLGNLRSQGNQALIAWSFRIINNALYHLGAVCFELDHGSQFRTKLLRVKSWSRLLHLIFKLTPAFTCYVAEIDLDHYIVVSDCSCRILIIKLF